MPTPCLAVKIRFECFLCVLDIIGEEGQIEVGHTFTGADFAGPGFYWNLVSGGTYYEFQDILAMGSLCRLREIRNIIYYLPPILFSKDTAIFPSPLSFSDHYVRIYINGAQTTDSFMNQILVNWGGSWANIADKISLGCEK